jgi:hypothetical protein
LFLFYKKESAFFSEEKKQKTFIRLRAAWRRHSKLPDDTASGRPYLGAIIITSGYEVLVADR